MTANRPYLPPISLPAFDALWRDWCMDTRRPALPKPAVLDCPASGRTLAERKNLERQARAELHRARYPGGMRGDHVTLNRVLGALAEPDVEMSLRWEGPRPARAMAVRRARLPVTAWIGQYPVDRPGGPIVEHRIQFTWGEPADLAADLVGLVPHRPAARVPGGTQTVELDKLRAAGRWASADGRANGPAGGAMYRALRELGECETVSRLFADLTVLRCLARGDLRVAVRASVHRRRPGPRILVNDTDAGRFLLTTRDGLVTVCGADSDELASRLTTEQTDLR